MYLVLYHRSSLLIFFSHFLPWPNTLTQFNVTGDVELVDDEDDIAGSTIAGESGRTDANGSTNNGSLR